MAQEFLLVSFTGGVRRVLANGDDVGQTGAVLRLDADEYEITLSGSGYAPASRDIVLSDTTVDQPMKVQFRRAAKKPKAGAGP